MDTIDTIEEGCPTPGLEGRCTAGFRSYPESTHQKRIEMAVKMPLKQSASNGNSLN